LTGAGFTTRTFPLISSELKGNYRGFLSRLMAVLRFRRDLKRCGDFLLEDPPPDAFVREPRRPRPPRLGGAIALELPTHESGSRSLLYRSRSSSHTTVPWDDVERIEGKGIVVRDIDSE
jgi:hypothetical protein